MPKIRKLRQHSALAFKPVPDLVTVNAAASAGGGNKPEVKLSKGQKKRLESKQKTMRKLGIGEQHLNEFDPKSDPSFSNFEAELKFVVEKDSSTVIKPAALSVITSNKMKKEVAVREAARMKLVQQHPTFQANPFAAINQHLTSMLQNKAVTQANTTGAGRNNKTKNRK